MRGRPRRPGFGVHLTRSGGGYIAFSAVAAAAATNTGNNGIYMAAALALSALAVSGVLSRRNLWRVRVRLEHAGELWAGSPGELQLRLRFAGWLRSRGLLLTAVTGGGEAGAVRVNVAPSGGELLVPIPLSYERRGVRPAPSIRVESGYPFGFFRKSRTLPLEGDVVVFPALLSDEALAAAPPTAWRGEAASARPGRSAEIGHLREFRPGDDPRDIHWKQTARNRRLIWKQRLAEGGGWIRLVLDGSRGGEEEFERLVSAAATVAVRLLARGESVALFTADCAVPPAAGESQRRRLLEELASSTRNVEPIALPDPLPGELRLDVREALA